MEQQNIFNYWGKAGNDESYHLLIYHCLDVAAVGREWLKQSSSFTKEAAKKLGLTEKGFIEWFTFFLALHDIGKFDIGFQNLRPDLLKILQQRESRSIYSTRHDQCGYNFWNNGIFLHIYYTSFESEKMANIKSYFDIFAKVTLGHHGLPPENKSSIKNIPDIVLDFTEKLLSLFVSEQSIDELKNLISLEKVERKTIIKESKNFSWKLAGLTTLCDWIASGDKAFIYISTREDLSEYFKSACNKAKEALSRSEVVSTKLSESVGIEHLFPQFSNSPTPLQRFCNETEISLSPQLWILEDVAGAGKTEAALTLTSRILKKNSGTGCFVALPTMATSNAMYERMAEVYSLLYDDGAKPSLSLSHGSSHLSEKFRNSFTTNLPDLPGDGEVFDENVEEGKAHCSQWLADSSKKALLADVGVGTVDQLLLAGLPVRYQSLRAFGMSQKVLIIDEVHAFDAYMLQVLTNIIATQASFGGSVVLLSATLPLSVREKFCDAFTKGLGIEEQEIRKHNKFPLVTSIDKHGIKETAVDTRDSVKRKVQLSFCEDIENVYSLIEQSVNEGKCVCWIRNTITDVSIAYEELDSRNIEKLDMFHSRFSLKDRLEIEKRVLKRFGKYSNDSDRRGQVLVASQVVEQSLDLDFDVMISDLAPIDLLIQRAGRLHRHSYRNKRTEPIFYIHSPKDTDTPTANWFSDDFISASYVYKDSAMLWRTKEILKQQKCIRMPEDARLLIESVYGENSIEIPDVFIQSEDNAWAEDMCKKSIASFNNLSFEQGYSRMSNDANKWDSEEKVSTRLSDNNNKLILCRWIDGKIIPIHKKDNFSWDLSALILRSSSLSSIQYPQDITSVIEELQKQKRFKYNTLFVVFQNEELKLVGKNANEKEVIIEYNSKTGLTINKSKEERS